MPLILLALILLGILGIGIYYSLNNSSKMEKTLEGFEDKKFNEVDPSDMMKKAEQAKKDLAKKQKQNELASIELIKESQKISKYLGKKGAEEEKKEQK